MDICTLCTSSFEDQEKYTCHECKITFHQSCITTWATHSIGEIIKISKTQCPNCQESLKISPIPGKIFDSSVIVNESELYKACKSCLKVFSCGDKNCDIQDDPTLCSECEQKIFECPKCHLTLEYSSGHSAFACCLYGWHGCKGSCCSHGKTDFAPFCGHRWKVESSKMTIIQGKKQSNPIGEVQTREICLRAVRRNVFFLQHVYNKTYEICLAAVTYYGQALEHVPEHLKTPGICLVAIIQNGLALRYVPEHLKTPELCLTAVKQHQSALEYVPRHLKTSEICLAAMTKNGIAFQYVPEHLKTPELCLEILTQNVYCLRYVPEHLKTPELCLEAVKKNGYTLEFVPEHLMTPEICLIAVKKNGWYLKFVPEHLKTLELCIAALNNKKYTLRFKNNFFKIFPKQIWSKHEFLLAIININGINVQKIYKKFRTPEIYLAAVNQNGLALGHIPEKSRSIEICHAAVNQNKNALKYVPNHLKQIIY